MAEEKLNKAQSNSNWVNNSSEFVYLKKGSASSGPGTTSAQMT